MNRFFFEKKKMKTMRGVIVKAPNNLFLCHSLKKPQLEKVKPPTEIHAKNLYNAEMDLLIRVAAVGINRIDILMKNNKYLSFPKGQNLGIEISGIVEETTCEQFKKNDRICSLLKCNGYNEYVLATSKHTIPLHESFSFIEGASLMESWVTAYKLIYYIARFPLINQHSSQQPSQHSSQQPSQHSSQQSSKKINGQNESNTNNMNNAEVKEEEETVEGRHVITSQNSHSHEIQQCPFFSGNEVNVLVYGALSSVGICLLQILSFEKKRKVMNINKIIAVTSNDIKGQKALDLGATDYAFHNKDDFVDSILKITNTVNLIFDCVGMSMFQKNLQICDVDTVWVMYGLLGGSKLSDFHLVKLISKRINLLTTTLYDRSDAYKENLINSFQKHLLPLLNKKILQCCIYSVLPIEEIEKAHSIIEKNQNIGKVVCTF